MEALACGTPVVACALPALQEVLGTRATFVDRDDLAGLSPPPRPPSPGARPTALDLGRRRGRDVDRLRARARVRVTLRTRRGA